MNDTWVKLYRRSLFNEVRRHDPTAWRLFETLLLLVDHSTGKWSGGIYQLTEADGSLNSNTIYKALKRLEENGMIVKRSNTRYSEISICKYSVYAKDGNTSRRNTGETEAKPSKTLTRSKEERIKNSNMLKTNELFNDLVSTLKLTRATYTPERKKKLEARLKRYTPDELRQVAVALANDAYMQGDNDAGKKYATIDYLIRNDEKIDYWLEQSAGSKGYSGKLSDITIEGDLK